MQRFILNHHQNKFFCDKQFLRHPGKIERNRRFIEIEIFYKGMGNENYISHITTWPEGNFIKMIEDEDKEIVIEL